MFIKYSDICIVVISNIIEVMIINVLFFIFKYFNDDNRMIINIIIEPVSGSKKVRIEGINVIIVNVMNVLFFLL